MSISSLATEVYESKRMHMLDTNPLYMRESMFQCNPNGAKVLEYEITESWNAIFCNAPFGLPQVAPPGELSITLLHAICEGIGEQFLKQFKWDRYQTMVFDLKDVELLSELYNRKKPFIVAVVEYINSLVNCTLGSFNGANAVKETFLENDQFFVRLVVDGLKTRHADDPAAKHDQLRRMRAYPCSAPEEITMEDVLQGERGLLMTTEQYKLFDALERKETKFSRGLIDTQRDLLRQSCMMNIYHATKVQLRRTFNTFEGLQRVEIDLSNVICKGWYPGANLRDWLCELVGEFLNFVFPNKYQVVRYEEIDQPRSNGLTQRLYSFIIVHREICPKDVKPAYREL